MEKKTRRKFITEVKQEMFYKFPVWLMNTKEYREITSSSKLLYMFLFNSLDGNKKDNDGNLFVSYSCGDLGRLMGCTKQAIMRRKKELNDYGLLEEYRRYGRHANRIYLKQPTEFEFDIQMEWSC